ncbi:hypothetical protein FJZ17_00230 [Candidatus Pacearchaeota archaeon]|nr:hypothetical protein [Candidatus Pacearchaeota archaeon]
MDQRGVNGQVVHLSTSQHRLFDFLRKRSGDHHVAPTLAEIQGEMGFSSLAETKRALTNLKSVDGIDVFTHIEREGVKKEPHYFLSPETIETTVKPRAEVTGSESQRPQRQTRFSALYVSEPGFGTKAYDPHSMLGLRLFLEANGLNREVQEVIFQGGVIPHLPPYASKANLTAMKFLGWIPRRPGEAKTISETMLEERVAQIDDPYLNDFYPKHVNNLERRKIRDLADAFDAAGTEVSTLLRCIPEEAQVRVQHGEEDRKNIDHIVDATIATWAGEKKEKLVSDQKVYERKIAALEYESARNKFLSDIYGNMGLMQEFARKPEEKLKAHQERVSARLKQLAGETFWEEEEHGLVLGKEVPKYLSWASSGKKTPEQYRGLVKAKLAKVQDQLREAQRLREDSKARLEELARSVTWTDQLLATNRASVTRFTRQYPVNPDEVEVAWNNAKNLYTRHYFRWDVLQQIHPHPSARKLVEVDSGVMDISSGRTIRAEAEVEEIKRGGKNLLLIHNIRSTFSDAVGPRAIRDAKLEQNVQNMVLRKLFNPTEGSGNAIDNRPDIILLGAHNGGGFRAMPWFKDSDIIGSAEGSDEPMAVEGQKISYLVNLPTMQSIERLDWLVGHGFSNWDTKRYLTGPYASGAVLHTEDAEGVNKFLFMGNTDLIRFGKIAKEIEAYRKAMGETKNAAEKRRLAQIIKERKAAVKLDFKKVEAAGDFHLGAPDIMGRYSKDQFIRAYQQYQREHGLPDVASWDELLHGVMQGKFDSGTRYLGLPPEKFRQSVVEPILADKNLNGDQKAYLLAQRAMGNLRAITDHNLADQERLFALLCKPYAQEILKKKGTLVLASGNHANNSVRNSDEAASLASQFDEAYRDNRQLQVFSGKGSSVGVGWTTLPGTKGRKLFVMHKFPVRQDEGYGVLSHLRSMNNESDVVIAGDRHQPIIFYADGHAGALHPGMEPINTYVPFVGKQAGVRGVVNVLYDPSKRETYGWEMVLNPTLEAIVKRDKML